MNRASGALRNHLRAMFLYVGGMILIVLTIVQMEITQRIVMHTAHFYYLVAMVAPPVLAGVARASKFKWAATSVAGAYFGMLFLIGRILPLFHAEPKLGPVYHQLDQFTPPEFPLLLIIPALALDLIWQRTGGWSTLRQALVSGAVFVAVFWAVQWPFATFLASPAARNWFFGAKYFGYYVAQGSLSANYGFVRTESGAAFWQEAALAVVTAIVTSWLGLWWGNWMQRIRR
jgi:hypothetical protein